MSGVLLQHQGVSIFQLDDKQKIIGRCLGLGTVKVRKIHPLLDFFQYSKLYTSGSIFWGLTVLEKFIIIITETPLLPPYHQHPPSIPLMLIDISPPAHYRWPRFFSMQPATWKIRNWHVLLPPNFSIDPPEPGEEGWKCRVWSTTPGRFPKQMLTPRCFKWWYIYIPRCCSVGLVYLYLLLANFIGKCR